MVDNPLPTDILSPQIDKNATSNRGLIRLSPRRYKAKNKFRYNIAPIKPYSKKF